MRTPSRPSPPGSGSFRELFDRVPIGLYRTTPAGEILDVNPAFVAMLGYPDKPALLAEIATSVYAETDARDRWLAEIDDKGSAAGLEAQWRRHDGTLIWVEESAYAVRDASGAVLHYVGSASDVTARRTAQTSLATERARFEQLFAASPEAIVLCANDGAILRANAAFLSLFGYDLHEVLGRDIDLLVAPEQDGLQTEARGITQQIADGQTSFVETRRRRKDGQWVHVSILGKPILMDGTQIAIYGIYRDITAQKRAEAALTLSHWKVEQLHGAADALGASDTEEEIYRITCEAAERVLGFTLGVLCIADGEEFACQAVSSSITLETLGRTRMDPEGTAMRALQSGQPIIVSDPAPASLPLGIPHSSRSLICAPIGELGVFQAASPEPDAFSKDDGRLLAILLRHTAVGVARLRLQKELIRQARHDVLTGAFNRRYFNEFIAQEVLRASRYDHPIGLLMIDVNRFKEINDRYGHQVGDSVLREIASVLLGTVRKTDMVVRYGGDEFLVVLTETGQEAEDAAQRVRAAVRSSEALRQISGFDVTVSVGSIFWHPDTGTPIEEALATADARMYDDKRLGRIGRS
ncbi:MAG: diguanylate cyclase [Candidatus Bipolaricaulota bacterium]